MSLRFILGRAGSGKTAFCLEEIRSELAGNPDGSPLIYLVPEQMTFQSEYQLSTTPGLGGNIRAQVLSFSRLALNVLKETGGLARYHLDSTGMNMLLRRILEGQKNNLRIFHRASEQPGFTEQLEEMLAEFKRYCILPSDLQTAEKRLKGVENRAAEQLLEDKLHDLMIIYQELEKELADRYLYGEDYLPLMAEKIHLSSYIKKAIIWIDGFHFFAPQELLVIEKLLANCSKVSLALTLDKPYDVSLPHDLNLFYQTALTFQRVRKLGLQLDITLEKPLILPASSRDVIRRFQGQPALAHLEKYFDYRPPVSCQTSTGITLAAAVNRRTEVEQAAREILTLVREQNYRFRDLAVMVRDLEQYHDLLRTIFHDYGIPLFLDQKRSMLHHPLVELIRSALEVVNKNWHYEAVFRCVKTDLLFPLDKWDRLDELREKMDKLENYILTFGISGYRWVQEGDWEYGEKQILGEINSWRQIVSQPLVELQQGLRKAKNGREMCTALFLLLENLAVPAKIEKWQQQAQEAGSLSQAKEHAQVWKAVLEFLDQMVEVIGGEKISVNLFVKLLETGLASMHFALVPPALDQVLAATLDRSRLSNIKGVFLLGINDGVLPARVKEKGILSEEERGIIGHKAGLELGPDSKRRLLDEQFLIYNALCSASDSLWLSYPLADEEGKALLPSNLINFIKKLFPSLQEKLLFTSPGESDGGADLSFVSHPEQTLSYLVSRLRQWQRGYSISPIWWDVYNWLVSNEEWRKKGRDLFKGLFYENQEQKLKSHTALKLYGKHLQASVTKVEKFQACPFAYFAAHGLKLKKRKIFRLEAPDIGQLFHEALTLFAKHIGDNKLDWQELSQEACYELAARVVDQLAPKIQGEILLSSSRYQYLTRKLTHVVGRSAIALGRHLGQSRFIPQGLELGFGPQEKLPAILLELNNGCTIELVGRIDRVDQAITPEGLYLRVVDYKSSKLELDLAEVYFGLALQMLTYLDVVIANSEKWLGQEAWPAGALYFHVHNPLLYSTKAMTDEQVERELFQSFKMKGLVLADPEVARLMDLELKQGSDIIPVRIKKDGDFDKRSSVINLPELEALCAHVRTIFKEAGQEIVDGIIHITPYKLKQKKACSFCLYQSFCQFDQALAENKFRILPADDQKVILEKIITKGRGQND